MIVAKVYGNEGRTGCTEFLVEEVEGKYYLEISEIDSYGNSYQKSREEIGKEVALGWINDPKNTTKK